MSSGKFAGKWRVEFVESCLEKRSPFTGIWRQFRNRKFEIGNGILTKVLTNAFMNEPKRFDVIGTETFLIRCLKTVLTRKGFEYSDLFL